ncbi:MAG: hypothetical protein M3015_00725 [Bacteroidota bacterium]|nr:hypothetical protein [Bacteroidota bacterium]
MNPKKIITVFLFAMFTVSVVPAFAGEPVPGAKIENTSADLRAQQVVNRLIEIRDMDKTNLTASEKRELRKEVKQLKKEAPKKKSGLYISLGALVIIALLLILLL